MSPENASVSYGSFLGVIRNSCVVVHNQLVDNVKKGIRSKDPFAHITECTKALSELGKILDRAMTQLPDLFSRLDKYHQDRLLQKKMGFWLWSKPLAEDIRKRSLENFMLVQTVLKKLELAQKDKELLEPAVKAFDQLDESLEGYIAELDTALQMLKAR